LDISAVKVENTNFKLWKIAKQNICSNCNFS